MNSGEEYKLCSDEILAKYQTIKNGISKDNTIVCQHLGTFSQDILISIVSIIEHTLVQNGATKTVQKRLSYLVIESIQNIMFHSDQLPDTHQLAYIIIEKNSNSYCIYSSNSILTKNIAPLTKKIDAFLNVKTSVLSKIFEKKIQTKKLNETGHGGIGLLTMVKKSDKNYSYEIKKVSENYSLFYVKLKLNY